ncbi:MAG: GAF domain-containing sensor histidine kinase, partial [FCB group bacterium]
RDYGKATFNNNGEVEYIDGIIEDVTDKIKTEEALYWHAGVNSAIAELSKAMISITTLDEISKLIFEHAKRLTQSKIGFIGYNINGEENKYIKIDNQPWEKIYCNVEIGKFWEPVNKYKENIIINSIHTDDNWNKKFESFPQITRLLSIYISSGDSEIGQIVMANAVHNYSEDDLEILERIASLLLVVLQKFRAENEIRSALSKEQELNNLKSRFIDLISHEYRTPLTAIGLSTELLIDYNDKLTEEDKRKQYEKIRDSQNAMNSLLDDIIAYSNFDAGKVLFSPTKLDLGLLCIDIVNEIKFLTKDKCFIDLTVNNNEFHPAVDEKIIRQVISILLLNAIKYSKPASAVEFNVNIQSGNIEFIVKDFGIGIPEEDHEQIFSPFHRGKNITNEPGTGLGLSIAKNSLQIHGGTITFTSMENEGSTFIVNIPFI